MHDLNGPQSTAFLLTLEPDRTEAAYPETSLPLPRRMALLPLRGKFPLVCRSDDILVKELRFKFVVVELLDWGRHDMVGVGMYFV